MTENRLEPLLEADCVELESEFSRARNVLGFLPASLLTMSRRPGLVRAFSELSTQVFMGADLSADLKDMIAHVTSAAAGCMYCQAHTAAKLKNKGMESEKITRVWEFEQSSLFDESERAALRLARDSAQLPNAVTNEHFSQLREHYSEDQIVDIVGIVSLFGFLNRWNDTFATPLEQEAATVAETLLAKRGWSIGKHSTK